MDIAGELYNKYADDLIYIRLECRIGDRVEVMETRPLSKDKRWRVTNIIERAK